MAHVSFTLLIPPLEYHVGDLSSMSEAQPVVEQPPKKRQRKVRQVFAETDFPGSYDRNKRNTEAGQKILKAAKGKNPKTPKKPADEKTQVSY